MTFAGQSGMPLAPLHAGQTASPWTLAQSFVSETKASKKMKKEYGMATAGDPYTSAISSAPHSPGKSHPPTRSFKHTTQMLAAAS